MHPFGLQNHFVSKLYGKGLKSGKNEDEKSFNRYVRQLVDQYLDKEVVISKQPEDKVELIVQACRERFPEYAHWTTTRIRIYIESCRRLKKIKNSPILLAKRKAAGRRFREGQKLKKMLASQYSIQAAEANRQLTDYLIRTGGQPALKPPTPPMNGPITHQYSGHNDSVSSSPVARLDEQINGLLKAETIGSPNSKQSLQINAINHLNTLSKQNSSFNPVINNLMQLTRSPSMLKIPTMLPTTTDAGGLITPPPVDMHHSIPSFQLPTMTPSLGSTVSSGLFPSLSTSPVASIKATTSPRTPPASSPSLMSNMSSILSNETSIKPEKEMDVSPSSPTLNNHVTSTTTESPPHLAKAFSSKRDEPMSGQDISCQLETSVSDAIGKVINAMLQQNEGITPPPPPAPIPISPKQRKSFQIESLMGSGVVTASTTSSSNSGVVASSTVLTTTATTALSSPSSMSMSEILNAKTLVTSYREAANFLNRAASELEQLLPMGHRVF